MTASDVLTGLGDVLSQQFNLSQNKNTSLNIAQNGTNPAVPYGKLGDFANQFDQSADRSYTEQGYRRPNYFAPKPNILNVLMQDPDATVLIKKRAFSSLAENFRPDLMDAQELLFYKATKVLFQNKCQQISNYEKLVKIAQISLAIGSVDESLLPAIFTITDNISQLPGSFANSGLNNPVNTSLQGFTNVVNRVREIVALSQDNLTTTWLTNVPNSFRSSFGEGTGVIELTVVKSLQTTTSINFNQGSFRLDIDDPYNFMFISNNDIDQAIYDANNTLYSSNFYQLGVQSLGQIISNNQLQLNQQRALRGASSIDFIVNPQTYLGQQITAIIESTGQQINFSASALSAITNSFSIDPSALFPNGNLGVNGLNDADQSLFKSIVQSLFTQLSLSTNAQKTSRQNNKELTYVRKKLRLHYGSKSIIQPMDTVHIYLKSKTKIDNKVSSGLESSFSGLTYLQGIQSTLTNINEFFATDNSQSVEKAFFVGANFPNWLWQAMRSKFVATDKGCHTFAGVVDEVTWSYNDGFNTVSVNGKDNANYFNYGLINFKPALDVWNGPLYDPLTPFDIKFDSTTGVQKNSAPDLLPENKNIFNSAFVKNKNGIFAGIAPTEKGFLNQDAQINGDFTTPNRIFYDPDGFVYRWKEGVATLSLTGDSYDAQKSIVGTPAITDDPWAGQDIVNVLSLLICGEPYNYATFYNAVAQFDTGFINDPATGENGSTSYFRTLQNGLKQRNSIYGNFVPFKLLTVDEKTYTSILKNQASASNFDSQLNDLLQKRATVADQLAWFNTGTPPTGGSTPQNTTDTSVILNLLKSYDTQIGAAITNTQNALGSINKPVSIYGNDISFDYSPTLAVGQNKNRLDATARRQLRREINFLTRRLIYKVRGNDDVSLLLVDDTFDKDTDIQAFSKAFSNMKLFQASNDFITVAEQIRQVAHLLELEVFSNSQGHIELRNPKYNRMPSSVFYNMLKLKNELGIQVFPQFLEDLYTDQIQTFQTQIATLEDEIRLYCLSIGYVTDDACVAFISNNTGALNVQGNSTAQFIFLSDSDTGVIYQDYRTLIQTSNPDAVLASINQALNTTQNESNIKNTFDIGRIVTVLNANIPNADGTVTDTNNPNQFQNLKSLASSADYISRMTEITTRLNAESGQQFDVTQIFGQSNGGQVTTVALTNMDQLAVLNNIAQRISTRQQAVKTLANALKNLQENVSLETQNNAKTNSVIAPNLNTSKQIPQMYESLIEDESYDDLGPGSGARYIIKNENIISKTFTETRPQFSSIDVTGNYGDQFIQNNELPQDYALFQNGNALAAVSAVDYDLWRMYGISTASSVPAPFLTDPDSQLAPYAVSILNRIKKTVISGNVTVVGNEYQQPGEVVYIEDQDQLFYIESVSHDFSFGNGFTTSIKLSYGHNPGEYIPTPYDVIGKLLYKNKDITNYVHNRQNTSFNQESLGAIVGNISSTQTSAISGSSDQLTDIIDGHYGPSNRAVLASIVNLATPILATASGSYLPVLELRIFFNSSITNFKTANAYCVDLANAVKKYLLGGSNLNGNAQPTGNTSDSLPSLSAFASANPPQVIVYPVDASPNIVGEYRYPSSKAFYYARDAVGNSPSGQVPSNLQTLVDQNLYSGIVDCWITFTNTNTANPNGT